MSTYSITKHQSLIDWKSPGPLHEELDVGLFKKYIPASFLMFKKTLYCKSTFSERWAGHTFCSEYGL